MKHHRSSMPLFDPPAPDVPIRDPTAAEGEAPRLRRQHRTIAARLREGPATNLELGAICQRFGARLHEMRRAGFLWKRTQVGPAVHRYEMVRDFLPAGEGGE